jgi:hypothetical protein
VDPEGEYERMEQMVVLGTPSSPPTLEEVLTVLEDPDRSVVVNLLGVGLDERPLLSAALLARLRELRTLVGRPHWIVMDEAHHLLPADWRPQDPAMLWQLDGTLLITVHPDRLARSVLAQVDVLAAISEDAPDAVMAVARASVLPLPQRVAPPGDGTGLLWRRSTRDVVALELARPRVERLRHRRKYAAGELGPDKSFWFRGEDDRLNLRAQNLTVFVQLAEGVDDATWAFHLRRGEYSEWIRSAIKDDDLADEVAAVEADPSVDAAASRRRIREAIDSRYTAPA